MSTVATTETIPGYIRLEKAAEIIGVSHSQVWRYIDDGLLDALKIGNTHMVKEDDAKSFERPQRGNPAFLRRKQQS
jgi:predicted site-specific integrase-resolvase